MGPDLDLENAERLAARTWQLLAVRGVVAIAFGLMLLAWPDIGLSVLLALVGAFALVEGVMTLVGAFRSPLLRRQRGWLVFEGILGIALGVVIFVWPDLSALGLLYAIGAWAIAVGALQAVAALALPLSGGRRLLLLLAGLLSGAFGVIMFARPGAGAVALLALVAAFAIVSGAMQIAFAFELRSLVRETKRRFQPPTTARSATHA
jgi:uncharacterized membrane protein HdeD (DUF308 family)